MREFFLPDDSGSPIKKTSASNSVIFIGANGSGKSRLGAWIEQQRPALVHRIVAQRNLNFNDNINLKSYQDSENLVLFGNMDPVNKMIKYGSLSDDPFTTYLSDDFNHILSALIAKSNLTTGEFVESCKQAEIAGNPHPPVPQTEIDKLHSIWKNIFPQRDLIYNNDCKFFSSIPGDPSTKYRASKMSDGERTALYFIAQVLCVPKDKILLIDEPELHLHKSLMNRLWLALEDMRPDCLFIYITHDTQFAALHTYADKYWVKRFYGSNHWEIEQVQNQDLPEDLLLDLLGNRKNVLFVEGDKGSLDIQLYSLIYKDYYIVPCGSCEQVINRTKAFQNTAILHHCQAYGIIDRDFRPETALEKYRANRIFSLDVAEVENLFITEEVIKRVAKHLGLDEQQSFDSIKNHIIQDRFQKQYTQQAALSAVSEIKHQLETLTIDINDDAFLESFNSDRIKIIKNQKLDFYKDVCQNGNYRDVLRCYNEKGLAKTVGRFLSLQNNVYCSTVINLFRNGAIGAPAEVLSNYLPSIDDIPR